MLGEIEVIFLLSTKLIDLSVKNVFLFAFSTIFLLLLVYMYKEFACSVLLHSTPSNCF